MSSHLRHRHDKLRQEPGKAWRNSISPRGWTILLACLRIDWELLGQSLGMPEAFISFQHEALSHCLETQVLQVRTSKELFDGICMEDNLNILELGTTWLIILVVLGSSALVSPS